MSVESNFTVLLHELAHLLCGHTGHKEIKRLKPNKRILLPERQKMTLTMEELEAETVSFLVSKRMGLEPRSAEYLAGYIKNLDDLKSISYETIIKTADKIDEIFLRKKRSKIDTQMAIQFE